jgi:hypothetical protein
MRRNKTGVDVSAEHPPSRIRGMEGQKENC